MRNPTTLLLFFVPLLLGVVPAQAPSLRAASVLPDPAVLSAASGTQRHAAIAGGATSSLVVFEDTRAGDTDLFAVRVDASGQVLDAVPIPVAMAAGEQTAAQVVWNGQDWLVGYLSTYDPGSGYFATQLQVVRVASTGTVLDATPRVLANDGTGMVFAMASDGVDWVAAYTGFSGGNNGVRARRIRADGVVLDPNGVNVLPAGGPLVFFLGVTWAGGNYLVSWSDGQVRGRRFSSSLAAIDAVPVLLPVAWGAVAGNGSEHLFSWIRQSSGGNDEVVVLRVAPTLQALDANAIAVSAASSSPNPTGVRACWDGSQWLVAWQQPGSGARLARFAAGTVLDPGGIGLLVDTPNFRNLGGLANGGGLLLWHDARLGSADDVYGIVCSAAGQVGSEQCYSLAPAAHRTPRVTAGGGGYLVTALGESSGHSRVLAWRLDALGRSVDVQPIDVASAPHARLQVGGAAWNGTTFLVVWADGALGQVFARRMLPDGSWVDAAAIPVQVGLDPDVAAVGTDFLVTCLRAPSLPQFVYSYAARVRGTDGAVLDSPALGVGTSFARRVRVVALGNRWLVATEAHSGQFSSQAGVDLRFVSTNGVVTSVGSMGVLNIPSVLGQIGLASAGTSALVAAPSGSNWTNTDILVQRIDANGAMTGGMVNITGTAGGGQFRPSVAWNGREYVVTYETYQNNIWSYDYEPDGYGVRVSEPGAPIDAAGLPWWNGTGYEVALAGDGMQHGRALHAAEVFSPSRGATVVEVRLQRSVGLASYGSGTPGCDGAHGIDGIGEPIAGNGSFAITADRGPSSGIGVLIVGLAAHVAGFDPGLGVQLHIDVSAPIVLVTLPTDQEGEFVMGMPLPAQPAVHGFELFGQAAFLWGGACQPSVSGFSASEGLRIEVLAP